MGEFDDDLDDDNAAESNLVKDLRKQIREKDKALKERDEKLSTFLAAERGKTVAELIKGAGGNEGYAKFYTGEDTSKEAVAAWIDENKELLGITASEPEPEEADDVRKVSAAAANAPQHKIGSMQAHLDAIRAARNPQELAAAYKAAGISIES